MSKSIPILFTTLVLMGLCATDGFSQGRRISIVRDAEIEHIISTYATPLFEAAGLSPEAVSVHLVRDRTLNAFVLGGQRIFINTGLLRRAKNPNQVIGVIAHETGHISGGHLAHTRDALNDASTTAIIATLLGVAAMVAGQGSAGTAIVAGGQQVAERTFLKYNRTQESAADQAALTILDRTGQSGRGLLEFLDILGDQESLLSANQDPYARTHPISNERIAVLRDRVQSSPSTGKPSSTREIEGFRRIQAKLAGFLDSPETTFRNYPEKDTSVSARYARAIAHYRLPDIDKALAEIDSLIAEFPNDPYFRELKGQMLFENGRIGPAVVAYQHAADLLPHSALILLGLGQAMIATGDKTLTQEAVEKLQQASHIEPRHPGIWHQLAIAYGRSKKLGLSAVASAEESLSRGRKGEAKMFATRALRLLPNGSPGWLRAQDIEFAAKNDKH